jgi:hypothetical protein
MKNIVIENSVLLPLQDGEEPGMPTYRVTGTIDGTKFSVDISCEIDGRDCEFENHENLEWEDEDGVFEVLCENEAWLKLHGTQCEAYYNM